MKVSNLIFFTLLLFMFPVVNASLIGGIESYYTFDEGSGSVAEDSIGNNNLELINPSWVTTGIINDAISLNGVDKYAIGQQPTTIGTTMTISAWFKTTATEVTQAIVGRRDASNARQWVINTNSITDEIDVRFYDGGSGATGVLQSGSTYNDGQWHHLVVTQSGDNASLYIDGVLLDTDNTAGKVSSNKKTEIGSVDLGAMQLWDGEIDEISLWTRELNASEVLELYNNGAGLQYPFGSTGTISIYNATNNQIINYQQVNVTNFNNLGLETKTTNSGFVGFNFLENQSNKLTFTSSGFDLNEFTVLPFGQTNLQVYLFENSQLVTLSVRDTAFNNIENAYILVEAIVNGQFVNYSSKLTDVTGSAAFNLILDDNYRITVSASGYLTRTFNIEVTEQAYTLVLDSVTGFNLDGPITGVFYRYDPKDTVLRDEIVNFTWRAFPDVNNLEYFSIELYNGTTLLQQNINTTNSGGIINILYDVSAFNNTYITAIYRFKKAGFPEFVLPVSYYIDIGGDTAGTIIQARQYAQNNIPIEIRVGVWMIFAFIVMFVLAFYGVLGTKNVLFSLLISLFPAYFLAVTFLPIISIIGLIVISWVTDGGTQQ